MPIQIGKLNYTKQTGTTSATANDAAKVKNRLPSEYDGATEILIEALVAEGIYVETNSATHVRTGTNSPAAEVTFEAGQITNHAIINLSPTTWVVAYDDGGDSNKGKAVVFILNGTTITAGTPVVFNDAVTNGIALTRISNTTFCVAAADNGGTDYLIARIGTVTVSNASVAFGTEKEITDAAIDVTDAFTVGVCLPRPGVLAFAYQLNADSKGMIVAATFTGTTIGTPGTDVEFEAGETINIGMDDIALGRVVIGYNDAGNSNFLTTVVCTVSAAAVCVAGSAEVHSGAAATSIEVHKAQENRGILTWIDTGDYHMLAFDIGTSGTTLAEGSDATVTGTVLTLSSAMYDPETGVLAFEDDAAADYGKTVSFTIAWAAMGSGGVISLGNTDVFAEADTQTVKVAGSAEQKFITAYDDAADSNISKAVYSAYVDDIIDVRSSATSVAYKHFLFPVFERVKT